MNFIEKILSNGYKRVLNEWNKNDVFNIKNGWMGLTIYHPYERFEKDNITVELSLERYNVTDTIVYPDGRIETTPIAEKRITIKENGEIIYDNKNGIFPPIEIENKWLM